MNTEIKTSAFCGLSRSEDFQKWLEVTNLELYEADEPGLTSVTQKAPLNTNHFVLMRDSMLLNKKHTLVTLKASIGQPVWPTGLENI